MNENSLKPGTVLRDSQRKYTVLKVLGHGGFGITYLVESEQVTAEGVSATVQYAIKEHFVGTLCSRDPQSQQVVSSQPVSGEISRSLKAFIAESRRLKSLGIDDPNLVKVFDVFESNGTAYMVMEYLDGGSLYDYVKAHGRLTFAQMEELMKPICRAVGVLHAHRVAHYDIKPHNIMLLKLKKGVYPVLIDFGLAKHYDGQGDATSAIAAAGYSLGYAPVEQYGGFKKFHPTADVYALAATMLFCLTGQRPPQAQELKPVDVYNQLLSLGVSVPQANAIANALEYKPEDRPATVDIFTQRVFAPIQQQSIQQPFQQPIQQPFQQPIQQQSQPQTPYWPQYQPQPRKKTGWLKGVLIALGCVAAIIVGLLILVAVLVPTPEDLYNEGCDYYNQGQYASAVDCFRQAAESDYGPAQWALGQCYDNGHGVPKNWDISAEWYRKSADNDCPEGQYELGLCYEGGFGVDESPSMAVYWYKKAAAANDTNAIFRLGHCYENGLGVTRDYNEAYNWYRKGAYLGSFQSQQALDDLLVPAE